MSSELYSEISNQLRDIEGKIKEAKDIITTARIAGEDVSALESQLREVEKRASSWKAALRAKGY